MADYIYSMETRLTPDQQRGVNRSSISYDQRPAFAGRLFFRKPI